MEATALAALEGVGQGCRRAQARAGSGDEDRRNLTQPCRLEAGRRAESGRAASTEKQEEEKGVRMGLNRKEALGTWERY